MAKEFFETIIASGGFAGETFDVTSGPPNTGIIDNLLNSGDGILTIDSPINIISTGILGANRDLHISELEQDGRMFFLSIRNSDIETNNISIISNASINNNISLVISEPIDYVFMHEFNGNWRAFELETESFDANFILTNKDGDVLVNQDGNVLVTG